MNDKSKCPQCGKPVSTESLMGLCPDCLLQAGQTDPHATQAAPLPPADIAEIAQLFPQLEIYECLGRGGMGAVYKARQPKLDRWVALKVLAREKQDDPQFAQRFTREAQTLARLNHPNIVAVHDFGEAGGHCYLLMEYVDGLNLRQLLQTGKMQPEEAVTIVPRICEALQFAHDHGIVHRDIKPENILLDQHGRVKVADFGIAKLLGRPSGSARLTADAEVIGTPHYMAPEQAEQPQRVDHRADIFSLGVVFYEMLTGELPLGKFAPPSQKVRMDIRLDQVVLRALEKEPDRRYQHASEVKTDVETIAGSSPPLASPPLSGRPSQRSAGTLSGESLAGEPISVSGKVTASAVGLIVASVLVLFSALKVLLLFTSPGQGWLTTLLANSGIQLPSEWIARVASSIALFKAVPAPLVLFGAVQMLRLRSYAWALAAAILALVSQGLVGIAAGIWALVVLTRPGVREAFAKTPRT